MLNRLQWVLLVILLCRKEGLRKTGVMFTKQSVPEVPDSSEDHCQPKPICGFGHFLISD